MNNHKANVAFRYDILSGSTSTLMYVVTDCVLYIM